MRLFVILTLVLWSEWISIETKTIEIETINESMITKKETLNFEGICGGTEKINVVVKTCKINPTKNVINIEGQIVTAFDEPYPYCKIGIGKQTESKLNLQTQTITDSTGHFSLNEAYELNSFIYFFDLGTTIKRISIDKLK